MRALRILKFVVIGLAILAVLSFFVWRLWNWLMPSVFGLHMISYAQAAGLLVLARILFGGFRGGLGRRMHWRRRMMERWGQMTPEEREKFRAGMGAGWGPFGPRATEPKSPPST
jgi:hypothetical protein